MFNSLPKDQIDQLQQHLIVPLAVADIIKHDLDVEPEMQYGLHMALSEIDPDSALLAIALCARDLADKWIEDTYIASALQKETNEIINEYGPTWLRYLKRGPMPQEVFKSLLNTVPEDLEALADLMDALCADLENENSSTFILASLLSIQARAHMEIADFMLEEIRREQYIRNDAPQGDGGLSEEDEIDLDAHTGNNIILFPGTYRD